MNKYHVDSLCTLNGVVESITTNVVTLLAAQKKHMTFLWQMFFLEKSARFLRFIIPEHKGHSFWRYEDVRIHIQLCKKLNLSLFIMTESPPFKAIFSVNPKSEIKKIRNRFPPAKRMVLRQNMSALRLV